MDGYEAPALPMLRETERIDTWGTSLDADLALPPEPRPNHTAYVSSWLKVLRGDKRAIFAAAAKPRRQELNTRGRMR